MSNQASQLSIEFNNSGNTPLVAPNSQPHPYRAAIPPVSDGAPRPLWSVMIPTYNCAAYLKETLAGVLAQDPGPELMQIEVIDDHSTQDDPARIVAELGQGRVGFYCQPENVGHIRNFETCLKRARGHLVHLLHGDDGVRDGFYQKVQAAFESRPDIGAVFCRQIFMDENSHWQDISPLEQPHSGILDNWLPRLALEQRIMTPSIVVRRQAYEKLGGFDSRLICAEDWEMWVRIAAHYPIWYEVEPLALYRMHFISNTGRHIRSGEDITYTCQAIDIFKSYLPPRQAAPITAQAKQTYALAALEMAGKLFTNGDAVAGMAQVRAALTCSRTLPVLLRLVQLAVEQGMSWLKRCFTRQKKAPYFYDTLPGRAAHEPVRHPEGTLHESS